MVVSSNPTRGGRCDGAVWRSAARDQRVAHHLYMAAELGMDYSAAQSTVIRAPQCGKKTIGVVSLHVNANGTVDSVEQLSDTLSEDCLQRLLKKYNSRGNFGPRAFIPAMHNGRPLESSSIQVVRWLEY